MVLAFLVIKSTKKCTLLDKLLTNFDIFLTIAIVKYLTTKTVENTIFFIFKC